jgi:chromate transporter
LRTLTPSQLFIAFSKIGISGFGGVLPWARRTIVEQEKWLSSEEFSAMLGICQVVPGPNIVNLAICIGTRFSGIPGAICAALGLLIAPSAVVILLGILYEHYSYMPIVQGMLRGVSAVGIGLIAGTGFKMMRSEFSYPPMLVVVVLTIVSAGFFHLGLGWVVLIASPFALYLAWRKANLS